MFIILSSAQLLWLGLAQLVMASFLMQLLSAGRSA